MDQRMNDVIRLCREIANQSEFKNTWKNIGKGMLIGATGAGLGGLLLGPVWCFTVAGTACSLLVWWTIMQFKSEPQIPITLQHAEKQKLHNVVAVLGNLTWTDTAQLVDIVLDNPALWEKFSGVVLNSIKKRV